MLRQLVRAVADLLLEVAAISGRTGQAQVLRAEAAGFINSNFVPVRVSDDDKAAAADAVREQYGVASLPTLLVVHDPKGEPRRLQGFPGKNLTVAFLKQALAATAPAAP